MRPTFTKCPTCKSRKIQLVEGDYVIAQGAKALIVPNVRRHECPACGEVLLDYDAMKQVEDRLKPAKKHRALSHSA